MRSIKTNSELSHLESRVLHYAQHYNRTLPEMRFFILDAMEFASLLLKGVYPSSPVNIWEGKQMVNTRHRIETGQESSLYYEVVQTGRPSYAYLNENNDAMCQASVMAHVVGHCEFSELNVLHDSNDDRTEYVMYLTNLVNRSRRQMGELNYRTYWNAAESIKSMLAPNSQFNLKRSVDSDLMTSIEEEDELQENTANPFPFSSTLDRLIHDPQKTLDRVVKDDIKQKSRRETLSRKGYKLKAPCEDVLDFLRNYAPSSAGEKSILDYMYTTHVTHDFVGRTQIMNEGWAMYWEKKIMMDLFGESACKGIIDYCKIFSGVCYPRPYFQRNPYHLGFHMWGHIEELFAKGKVSQAFHEETDRKKQATWNKGGTETPLKSMENIVKTCTDYEFLRRFLTNDLIEELHLNRLHKSQAKQYGITADDIYQEDKQWVWLHRDGIKDEMLKFFTHMYRPRIYLIDDDFLDGGLLLYHRDDDRELRQDWIRPTLKNINLLWKGPVSLLTKDALYTHTSTTFTQNKSVQPSFELVKDRMRDGVKPFRYK